jgi:hypothetical protein
MKQIDHPHVIKFYDTFEDEFNVYIIMELLDCYIFHFSLFIHHFPQWNCLIISKPSSNTANATPCASSAKFSKPLNISTPKTLLIATLNPKTFYLKSVTTLIRSKSSILAWQKCSIAARTFAILWAHPSFAFSFFYSHFCYHFLI